MVIYVNSLISSALIHGIYIGTTILIGALFGYIYYKHKTTNIIYSQQLNNVFNEFGIPVIVLSKNRIIEVNKATLTFFKASKEEEMVGKNPLDFLPENYHHYFNKRIKRMAKTRSSNIDSKYQFIRLDGTKVSTLVHAEPISTKGELILQVVLIESDHILRMNQRLQNSERKIRDLVLHLNEGIGVFKLLPEQNDGFLVFSNRKFVEYLIGSPKLEIYERFSNLFKPYLAYLHTNFETLFKQFKNKIIKKEIFDEERMKYFQVIFYINLENQLVVHLRDITTEKELVKQFENEKQQLEEILDATGTLLWSYNKEKKQLHFHHHSIKPFINDFGVEGAIQAKYLLDICHPNDRDILFNYFYGYHHNSDEYFSFEVRLRNTKNIYRWMLIRGQVVENAESGKRTISGTAQDVTEHKENEEEILFLSKHDHLTKVYNLRAYSELASQLDVPESYPMSIALIDVNGLKVFNDAFSHATGDELLIETANQLHDAMNEKDILARIGGDEFICLMPQTSLEEAEKRFKMIADRLGEIRISGIPISISYGIVEKYDEHLTMDQMKNMADSKMYQQKYQGSDTRIRILELIKNHFFDVYDFEKNVVEMVHEYALELGNQMDLDYKTMSYLDIASTYYNIGIFAIKKEVFNKRREFKDYNLLEYQKHVKTGYRILLATHRDEQIARAVLHHHEKYNGEGYPGRLKGKDIPLASRIIAILATYSRRRLLGHSEKQVRDYLESERGVTYDPEILDIFYKILELKNKTL